MSATGLAGLARLRCRHAVHGQRHLVQVALRHNSRGVNELLKIGAAGDRRGIEMGGCAKVCQLHVDHGVAFRQQPCGLRRCLGPQIQRKANRQEDGEGDDQRDDGALSLELHGV